jgi:hypothetical protein
MVIPLDQRVHKQQNRRRLAEGVPCRAKSPGSRSLISKTVSGASEWRLSEPVRKVLRFCELCNGLICHAAPAFRITALHGKPQLNVDFPNDLPATLSLIPLAGDSAENPYSSTS